MPADKLRVVILKPSKYGINGYVERFRRGFMPNSTLPYLHCMTPSTLDGVSIETIAIDEYVHPSLDYLRLFDDPDRPTLLALAGVQSHQFQRSLDLAAYALDHGVRHCVIGGPHPMTCDTSALQNRGVSFALAEAEVIWLRILRDAIRGELEPVYGREQRWQQSIEAPVVLPPSATDLRRHVVPMLGLYPARGCPFTCNFCSVIKIAGHRIRSQDVETVMASLRAARAADVKLVMFTSDNFNKYPDAEELLQRMISERIRIPFFVQCDTQIARQENFVHLLGRAGCFQMFIGVESFSRQTLLGVHKAQNHPETYREIVRICRAHGVGSHFSNIIGFPSDTPDSVREHLAALRDIGPDWASFYVLTPIPGTQQYDEFRAAGKITEANMDRFDTTYPTWRHPSMDNEEWLSLLFECYRKFYSLGQTWQIVRNGFHPGQICPDLTVLAAAPLFMRYSASRRVHPMSGGVGQVRRDHVSDYIGRRKRRFDCELVPLPDSLELPEADAAFNRMGRVV